MNKDIMNLARAMLCSQTSFLEKRILDTKYRKAFKSTALYFIDLSTKFDDRSNNSILEFKTQILLAKADIENSAPSYVKSLFNDEHQYKLLAVEMVEDIVDSLTLRFVHGDSRTYLGLFNVVEELC